VKKNQKKQDTMPDKRRNSLSQLNKLLPVPIQLNNFEDDIETADVLASRLSHITNVMVGEHHTVSGQIGKPYVVWSIKIILDDSDYASIVLYKRYSELEQFRSQLLAQFPSESKNIPPLPSKDNVNLDRLFMTNKWLEHRRRGLQWFLSNILLNPRFQSSFIVKEFILN
jgi:hypothetical protein